MMFEREKFPAIYNEIPHPKLSKKYAFASTGELIDAMIKNGWTVNEVKQSNSRNPDFKMFVPHQVRMVHSSLPEVGDTIPELIINNSHNGKKVLHIRLGLRRLVCKNGLTIPTDISKSISKKHRVLKMEDIKSIINKVANTLPEVDRKVTKMRNTFIDTNTQIEFLKRSTEIRWPEGVKFIYDDEFVDDFLTPTRKEDMGIDDKNSVWNVLNIIHEKHEKGGFMYVPIRKSKREGKRVKPRRKARPISNFMRMEEINVELFKLAESYI